MDLSARAFALYRKLTTLFRPRDITGPGSRQLLPPKSEANRIGVQAFVLLYSRFVGTDGSSGLRICTREPVRLTDVVETSYPGTQGWYGLQRIFPLEFFLGGLTGIADRFGLRRTTDESK